MALSGSLNFLSASTVGSVRIPAASDPIEIFYGKEENSGGQEFVPNDFVGLNTNIYEPFKDLNNEQYSGVAKQNKFANIE